MDLLSLSQLEGKLITHCTADGLELSIYQGNIDRVTVNSILSKDTGAQAM